MASIWSWSRGKCTGLLSSLTFLSTYFWCFLFSSSSSSRCMRTDFTCLTSSVRSSSSCWVISSASVTKYRVVMRECCCMLLNWLRVRRIPLSNRSMTPCSRSNSFNACFCRCPYEFSRCDHCLLCSWGVEDCFNGAVWPLPDKPPWLAGDFCLWECLGGREEHSGQGLRFLMSWWSLMCSYIGFWRVSFCILHLVSPSLIVFALVSLMPTYEKSFISYQLFILIDQL